MKVKAVVALAGLQNYFWGEWCEKKYYQNEKMIVIMRNF